MDVFKFPGSIYVLDNYVVSSTHWIKNGAGNSNLLKISEQSMPKIILYFVYKNSLSNLCTK